jgi:hypothetical protein
MRKRLFQDCVGKIDQFIGVDYSSVKSLRFEDEPDDVLLLWMQNNHTKNWYRIFIDGAYCGIDEFLENLLDDYDYEEGDVLIDHSGWFKDKHVIQAEVKYEAVGSHIALSIVFEGENIMILNCLSPDGKCILQFIPA